MYERPIVKQIVKRLQEPRRFVQVSHEGRCREAWERLHPELQMRKPYADFAAGFTIAAHLSFPTALR